MHWFCSIHHTPTLPYAPRPIALTIAKSSNVNGVNSLDTSLSLRLQRRHIFIMTSCICFCALRPPKRTLRKVSHINYVKRRARESCANTLASGRNCAVNAAASVYELPVGTLVRMCTRSRRRRCVLKRRLVLSSKKKARTRSPSLAVCVRAYLHKALYALMCSRRSKRDACLNDTTSARHRHIIKDRTNSNGAFFMITARSNAKQNR